MKKCLYLLLLLIVGNQVLNAQSKSLNLKISKLASVDCRKSIYNPSFGVQRVAKFNAQFEGHIYELEYRKNNNRFITNSSVEGPKILSSFESEKLETWWTPDDNSIAVSNEGIIAAAINSELHIHYPDTTSSIQLTFQSFAQELDLNAGKFDPNILYDSDEDKFIFVFLNGYESSTSKIVIAFSQTNDPGEGWNFYTVDGNVLEDTSWTDFPRIAISEKELYISVANYDDASAWGNYFCKGTRVLQIDKESGYDGESLDMLYHYSIGPINDAVPITNNEYILTPIKGGIGPKNSNMLFVSTKSFSEENDTVFLLELDGLIADSPSFIIDTLITDVSFGTPPVAKQEGYHKLISNSNIILDGYYENDQLHYVLNTIDFNTNKPGIYHGVINNISGDRIITGHIISDTLYDYAHVGIVYTGHGSNDKAMLLFNHSSDDGYPGHSAIKYVDGEYSSIISVKEGESIMNVTSNKEERWGDYIGLQRDYKENDLVWACSSFGKNNKSAVWISSLSTTATAIAEEEQMNHQINVFPNPVRNHFVIEFENPIYQHLTFELYNIKGQRVKILFDDMIRSGINRLGYNASELSNGVYIIKASNKNGELLNEKIVVN